MYVNTDICTYICIPYCSFRPLNDPPISLHAIPMKYQDFLVSFPLKKQLFSFVKLFTVRFKTEVRLVVFNRTENVMYHFMGRNNLTCNGCVEKSFKNNDTMCSTPRMTIN